MKWEVGAPQGYPDAAPATVNEQKTGITPLCDAHGKAPVSG